MKTNFKFLGIGLLLCLLPGFLQAQEVLTGFRHSMDKVAAKTRVSTVQTLPFYDDFSSSWIFPDSTKWLSPNIYINPGFPLHPVTRNAATFDVLDANGEVYEYAISVPFISEYLYSTTIRLDSVFEPEPRALTPADSVYLSFLYQPQGNGNAPETNDSLVLEFGTPNEFDTTWHHIWSVPGTTLSQFLQENDSNYFKQVMIPITDLRYFTNNFFFRFYNYASIANQSQPANRGNEDNWNIDVVYLDCHRSGQDPSYPKICFAEETPNFLVRYQSMPYKHYRANPTSSISTDGFTYHLSNLDRVPHTVKYRYQFDQVNGNQHASYEYSPINNPLFEVPAQQYSMVRHPAIINAFGIDYDRDTTSFLIRHYISDTTCVPPLMDSMIYHQGFYNYFAYDDGIPEMGYGVEPAMGSFAVRFDLFEMDTISGVQILFNHTLNDANNKYFDIVVWKDNNGKPGEEVYRLTYRKPRWGEKIYEFTYYEFDRIVRLNGFFYIGIEQRESGLINVGFDTSRDNSQFNFYNTSGTWQASTKRGSIMIRPAVGKGYFIGLDEPSTKDEVKVYPNPATTTLRVEGIDEGASIRLYDLTGRMVLQTQQTTFSVEGLSGGLYLLNVINPDGTQTCKKITVKP